MCMLQIIHTHTHTHTQCFVKLLYSHGLAPSASYLLGDGLSIFSCWWHEWEPCLILQTLLRLFAQCFPIFHETKQVTQPSPETRWEGTVSYLAKSVGHIDSSPQQWAIKLDLLRFILSLDCWPSLLRSCFSRAGAQNSRGHDGSLFPFAG